MKDIWQEKYTVQFGDVDQSGRLAPTAVFEYFQNVAMNHAGDLGCGREVMQKAGQVWILSRLSVVMEKRPKLGQSITVRSWPRSWEKLFALRDYDILDETGRPLIYGRSGWIILDIEKRRPLRPQTIVDTLPPNEGRNALPSGARALASRQDLARVGERKAVYSDIDCNGHVNNVRYIQWISDIIDAEQLASADLIRLDINYISEIFPGEITELWTVPVESEEFQSVTAIEGRRQGNGEVNFRAELSTARQEQGEKLVNIPENVR
jgi:acyl-ACP thioesterase